MKEFIKRVSELTVSLKAPKGQYNSFGKYSYRNCEDILEAVKPLLNGMMVTVTDDIVVIGERVYVKSTAKITDGENSLENTAFAREPDFQKGMNDSQITGSASSYARKYALNGLLCIDDTKDADSQDNSQNKSQQQKPAQKTDYTARNNLINDIKGLAAKLTEGQSPEQKMSFMKKSLQVGEFKELFRKNDKALNEIYENLRDMQ